MEIPDKLKLLYKHWLYHTQPSNSNIQIKLDNAELEKIFIFINERMHIWEKKHTNKNLPYTNNEILRKYRFCNIYRELDKQTIEIHTQLKHLENNFDLWLLNILYSRMVCNPATITKTGFLNFDHKNNLNVKSILMSLERPKYGVAYIFPISIINKTGCKNREDFFCEYLPYVTKDCAKIISNLNKSSVVDALEKVLPAFGLNFKFHWTEVLIDVAYQYPHYIDLYKRFPIGPGSLQTMKKLNKDEHPELVCESLVNLKIPDFPYLTFDGKRVLLSAENWEGIGCEFRKYTNLSLGQGRHRIYR